MVGILVWPVVADRGCSDRQDRFSRAPAKLHRRGDLYAGGKVRQNQVCSHARWQPLAAHFNGLGRDAAALFCGRIFVARGVGLRILFQRNRPQPRAPLPLGVQASSTFRCCCWVPGQCGYAAVCWAKRAAAVDNCGPKIGVDG